MNYFLFVIPLAAAVITWIAKDPYGENIELIVIITGLLLGVITVALGGYLLDKKKNISLMIMSACLIGFWSFFSLAFAFPGCGGGMGGAIACRIAEILLPGILLFLVSQSTIFIIQWFLLRES